MNSKDEKELWIKLYNEMQVKTWEISTHFDYVLAKIVCETHKFDKLLSDFNKASGALKKAVDEHITKNYK